MRPLTVGLFDSGLGGLTVARVLLERFPALRLVYLGDTARTPYGNKSPETIMRYSRECAAFLLDQEIDALVVACNTASAIAAPTLRRELNIPVVGMIEGAVHTALELTQSLRIGVIATEATIKSGIYQRSLRELRPAVEVWGKACPLFVPLVEDGLTEGPIVEQIIEHYLRDLKMQRPDAVILGCTHYPMLRETLQCYFGGSVALVESGAAAAGRLSNELTALRHTMNRESPPEHSFFVTEGTERFEILARRFMQTTMHAVRQAQLGSYTNLRQ